MSQEFKLIDQYFLPLSRRLSKGEIGIGDDGAVMTPPANHQLVVVTDTLVEGVHFPVNTPPQDLAWKAVAVNLSDLAAMGAKPGFISLALTLPKNDQAWLASFTLGLSAICTQYKMPLIGGDTTKGPLTITVTAHGWVEHSKALLRSGAQVGDVIVVSGEIGNAGLGLKFALNQLPKSEQAWFNEHDIKTCLEALNRPIPQVELGRLLQNYATSAIDISDGLLADLGHILEQSNHQFSLQQGAKREADIGMDFDVNIGAEIYLDHLPVSMAMNKWLKQKQDWSLPLSAGDDYQLCFTVNPQHWQALRLAAKKQGVCIASVGTITQYAGVKIKHNETSNEAMQHLNNLGYQHF